MGYLVFARKYRPQVFEDVIGQHHVTQTLQNAITGGRVAHALLFAGPRGVGKTSAARILAKALNCATGPTPKPCDRCESCQEISSGISMDVIEIDGASNRGINEIRELRENVKYAPARGRHKIFIIDEVHMLTPEAFNALLKTLEEPPGHIVFIFATTEPNKIPITILSRCQRFDFRRISLKEIIQRLEDIIAREEIKISENSLVVLAREAEGSLRDAQSLLDQVISFAGDKVRDEDVAEVLGVVDRRLLYDTSMAVASHDGQRCLEILDELNQYGYDFRQFSRSLLDHFRNLLVVHIAKNPETLLDLPKNELDELVDQTEKFDLRQVQQCFNVLLQTDSDLSRSTFPRLIMEIALLKMVDIQPVVRVDEILSRLESLEERLSRPMERPDTPDSQSPKAASHVDSERKPGTPGKPSGSDDNKREETQSGNAEILESTWRGILEFASRENPVLGALLSHGRLLCLDDRSIEIGFTPGSFYYERIQEEANKKAFAGICRSLLKKDLQPVFSIVKRTSQSSPDHRGERETDRDRRLRKEVLESPIVKDALEIFDGEIEEVKVGTRFEP
ncbi:MAG: DNA polymerase III subunit gamma/tau [Proteobacteria bacterium]|nr:DNA polymerase III subunit gamma/tau [Pseudomonadota bacterium]